MRIAGFVLGIFLVLDGFSSADARSAGGASSELPSDVSAAWASDWSTKNLDAVMALYAPDAEFMPGSTESWVGTAVIRKSFAGVLSQYSAKVHLHSVRIEASGNLAYDSGLYDETVTPVKGGKALQFRGNYLFVFRHVKNGEWKILEQTWTEFGPSKL